MQRRIGSLRDRRRQAACLEERLRDAISNDELFVMAGVTHERPTVSGRSSEKYRSFSVPRMCPSGAEPAISGRVVGSDARSAISAASGSARHVMACSTGGRLPISS
jgi:hypothetical protein